ncbi:MAG: hypothetical protein Q9166_006582 [cf. Caloplaca sp. 2 TL-2023]
MPSGKYFTLDGSTKGSNTKAGSTVTGSGKSGSGKSGSTTSQTWSSGADEKKKGDDDPTVSKMVDWCLGLELSPTQETIVNKAFHTIPENTRSLNQSLLYIDNVPLFLDIEIKKSSPGRDAELQLAVWACAAMKKKLEMGWDASMPMPGLVIEGHLWQYYVFVRIQGDLIMIGPFHMGNTSTLVGVWMIVYRLNLLMKWGTTVYKKWFEDNVMTWATERAKLFGQEKGAALVEDTGALNIDDSTDEDTDYDDDDY